MFNDKPIKISADITADNNNLLDSRRKYLGIKKSTTINELIATFCNIPESVKQDMIGYCKNKLKQDYSKMNIVGDFEMEELKKEISSLEQIAKFLNDGKEITVKEVLSTPNMQTIAIKNGSVLYPAEWIIVNPEIAQQCEYAGVIECRNGSKLGIPHFLYFSKQRMISDSEIEQLHNLCIQKWPKFKEKVLDKQVTLIPDSNNFGEYINAEDYLAAPIIGYFNIAREGDPSLPPNYKFPSGAKIISN